MHGGGGSREKERAVKVFGTAEISGRLFGRVWGSALMEGCASQPHAHLPAGRLASVGRA